MKIKRISLLIITVFAICAYLTIYAFKDRSKAEIDVVAVNDIVQNIANQLERLEQTRLPGLQYGMDYVILDGNNNFIAATRPGLREELNTAIKNRDTIIDITKNDELLGKLIIFNDSGEIWQRYRTHLLSFTLLVMIIVAALCLIYVIYLDRTIFRPFRKLQNFARQVAAGNLDIPLEMDKGNLFGAFTESFDLMRDELNKARENERAANQSKKELVASLSHDIKTPVASIKAVSEVMHARSQDATLQSQLEIINAKADQINTLIMNMFSATLEELQELKVTVTEQSSELLYNLIEKADYDNQVTLTGMPECIIRVDEMRLAQVIDNVISNSYKYAGTSIDVTAKIVGTYLELEFKDYGLGVSEDERPLIFNKFYRAKNAVNKSGTGLGLYITKYLINKMSGAIDCANEEDGFVIKLKLQIA